MQTQRRVAANPQNKPVDLGCESAENWQLSSTSTIAIVIITHPSFYRPTKGRRLSRPKHCSKGAQPVLKTVYRSSRRDKHNCPRRDSNLDPLTPQSDALITRPLRPAVVLTCPETVHRRPRMMKEIKTRLKTVDYHKYHVHTKFRCQTAVNC